MHIISAFLCVVVLSPRWFYPYPSGSLHCQWGNLMICQCLGINPKQYGWIYHMSPLLTDNTSTKQAQYNKLRISWVRYSWADIPGCEINITQLKSGYEDFYKIYIYFFVIRTSANPPAAQLGVCTSVQWHGPIPNLTVASTSNYHHVAGNTHH